MSRLYQARVIDGKILEINYPSHDLPEGTVAVELILNGKGNKKRVVIMTDVAGWMPHDVIRLACLQAGVELR